MMEKYELELIPKNDYEETTFILMNEIGYSKELVEFVENEFENEMSDFKKIITRNASFPYEIINETKI